ncbi:MAG: nucleoside monophosphate kinase [Candidatus Pacebacteria bacterium]|jgi:adenylate kinase|nr:nucleoside monophosphate kinase [Candidatus Paceibacterota bacterium]
MTRTIFFLGKPGSGKETQARLLAEKTGFTVLSTGEKFRELRERRDALGDHIRSEYDAGRLMPDWFADFLFQESVLNLSAGAGIIFEGSGRTVEQVTIIDKVLNWLGREYVFVNLDISDDEAVRRMLSRGRLDSNSEDKVRVRLAQYQEHSVPVLEHLTAQSKLLVIPGERSVEDIHADICTRLGV